MSAPITETARPELRASGSAVSPRIVPVPLPPGRRVLLDERRRLRRQRRIYAWCGLLILLGLLAVTIVVLDLVR
jgi:hypothetical protein